MIYGLGVVGSLLARLDTIFFAGGSFFLQGGLGGVFVVCSRDKILQEAFNQTCKACMLQSTKVIRQDDGIAWV